MKRFLLPFMVFHKVLYLAAYNFLQSKLIGCILLIEFTRTISLKTLPVIKGEFRKDDLFVVYYPIPNVL